MLLNCGRLLAWSKENVETRSGAWLHRFEPIPDKEIGEIDGKAWNVLDRYDDKTKLLHLTSGGPWLKGCEDHPYGAVWFDYRKKGDKPGKQPWSQSLNGENIQRLQERLVELQKEGKWEGKIGTWGD